MSNVLVKIVFLTGMLITTNVLALKVELYKPIAQPNDKKVVLTGTVESSQTSKIAIQQSGLVAELLVDAGDEVEKGQPLVKLDDTLAKLVLSQVNAELASTRVEIKEAQRLYNEAKALAEEKLIAKSTISERRAALATAKAGLVKKEAELALQKEVLSRHTLKAPFSGIVAMRNVNVGEWITPQTNVMTLVNTQTLRLPLAIPQEYFSYFAANAQVPAHLVFDDATGLRIKSKVSQIVPFAKSNSRTFIAYIALEADRRLIAGMSAQVELILPSDSADLVWLPKSAIKQHPDGGTSVFAAVDGKAKRFLVKIVSTKGAQVAVSGAPADAEYVVSGVELLADNQTLTASVSKGQ